MKNLMLIAVFFFFLSGCMGAVSTTMYNEEGVESSFDAHNEICSSEGVNKEECATLVANCWTELQQSGRFVPKQGMWKPLDVPEKRNIVNRHRVDKCLAQKLGSELIYSTYYNNDSNEVVGDYAVNRCHIKCENAENYNGCLKECFKPIGPNIVE